MKRWNKLRNLSLFLAGSMLLMTAGCAGKEESGKAWDGGKEKNSSGTDDENTQDVAKGRYTETQKTTPDGLNTIEEMVRLSDGSVALLNPDKGSLLISRDNGDSWEEKELPALAGQTGIETIEITSRAIAPDGAVFFSYVDWEETAENGVNERYIYIDKDGNESEINLTEPSGDKFYLSWAAFTGERTLAALMNGGDAYTINLDDGIMNKISESQENFDMIFTAGDYLLTKNWMYQLSAGSATEDEKLREFIQKESPMNREAAFCYNARENTVYAAARSGLYSHVMGGSSMEKLLDGGLCSLGDPTKKVSGILQNEDGSFLIGYEDGELDLYQYDADVPAVPTQQISIFSMEQNLTVSRAVSIFRKSHPDVYVKQEYGLSGDYGVTKEDAIRNLNTRLLAGEGPDILLLDGMPLDSYIEKNMLLDLTETIGSLEQESKYFSDILKSYENDQGLYAVPLRFRVPMLMGETETIGGVTDIASLAAAVKTAKEKAPDAITALGTYTPEELLKKLYMTLPSSAFVKDGETDREALLDFLTHAKEIYEEEQKNITPEVLRGHNNSIQWREENGLMHEEGSFPIDASSVAEVLGKQSRLVLATISSVEDLQYAVGLLEHEKLPNASYVLAGKEHVFAPKGICGVNAKSKEEELSLEFFSTLLHADTQKADLSDGLPVNEDAFEKFFENPNPNDEHVIGFNTSIAGDDGETEDRIHFEVSWPKQDAVDALKEKVKQLSVPGLSDDVVKDAILESGAKVLSGNLSAEEGCGEIVQKLDLYLAE